MLAIPVLLATRYSSQIVFVWVTCRVADHFYETFFGPFGCVAYWSMTGQCMIRRSYLRAQSI